MKPLANFAAAATTAWGALKGRTPERYKTHPYTRYDAEIACLLRPGIRVLDVGSGRRPHLPPEQRPEGCYYHGLDISAKELSLASAGSYDATTVADVTKPVPTLNDQFDLIISCDVLEHLRPLPSAIENLRSYLRPNGTLIAAHAGKLALFALANEVIPSRLSKLLMQRFFDRAPETVFPAYYDRCWYSGLKKAFSRWHSVRIETIYWGAGYFRVVRLLFAIYLGYEEWALRGRHRNLATHYIIIGRK